MFQTIADLTLLTSRSLLTTLKLIRVASTQHLNTLTLYASKKCANNWHHFCLYHILVLRIHDWIFKCWQQRSVYRNYVRFFIVDGWTPCCTCLELRTFIINYTSSRYISFFLYLPAMVDIVRWWRNWHNLGVGGVCWKLWLTLLRDIHTPHTKRISI